MQDFQNMSQVNQALEALIPSAFIAVKDYKLQRMEELLAAIGNPERSLQVIHIAGTSGKTSTSYYVAAGLQQAGFKTGLTVSPHVDSVTERVQVGGKPLSEEKFCQYFSEFFPKLTGLEMQPSYFECLVALAYYVFAKEKVDYAVIEVGMGGRKDPTNVMEVTDKVCVITDIGLDHTEVLGETLDLIAGEKAGIIKSGNHVFMYEQAPEVMTVVDDVVAKQKANLHLVRPPEGQAPDDLPLFQQRNWFLAQNVVNHVLETAHHQELDKQQVKQASHVQVPSRMETVRLGEQTLIMDGAHNGQKMKALVASLQDMYADQKFAILVAFVTSGNPRAFEAMDELLPIASRLIVTGFSGKQDTPKVSIDPQIIADYARSKSFADVVIEPNPEHAFEKLLKTDQPLLLVTGSFFLMNHVRPLVRGLQ